jgi:predicted nucleic acid-binding Zn ribbon protein
MVEDAVGEVVGSAIEVAAETLGEIGSSGFDKVRRRKGCWRLLIVLVAIVLVVGIVIALTS